MLTINQTSNAGGAAKYFEENLVRGDYYSSGDLTKGAWGGRAAERLGLSGEVAKDDFVALCHNQKPDGSKLNPRHSARRKVGYDFTFNCPKSVSLLEAITGDKNIRLAFESAVEETMHDIEQNMRTQIGQGKDKQHVQTGEMIWAGFCHKTSRPVDGIPDPHLHKHIFIFNTTWNGDKQRFQAGEFGDIKSTAPLYEAMFHARLAAKIKDLGFAIEHKVSAKGRRSWEIAGLDKTTLEKFSRRTSLIEKIAAGQQAQKGHITAKQKASLGAIHREKKLVGQSYEKLQEGWKLRLKEEESDAIFKSHLGGLSVDRREAVTAEMALDRAVEDVFERKSVVKAYQLKAEALKRGYGDVLPEEIQATIDLDVGHGRLIRREVHGTTFITTREALEEENKILTTVREGKGKYRALNDEYRPKADFLSQEQRRAIKRVLTDVNSVSIVSGGAGTGKTTLMTEIRQGIEQKGHKILAFAPSTGARDVLREEGFKKAETVARLLVDPKLQDQVKNAVILIDEAGLLGNSDMNKVLAIADKHNARILLSGDARQHSSVARGDALRLLEQKSGIKVARVNEIQRQKSNVHYKLAVRMASEGKADAALHQLDQMGEVVEIEEGRHRLTMLVTDFTEAIKAGKSALIVSPTHIEGQNVTDTLRERLKLDGVIKGEERHFTRLKNVNWTEENKTDSNRYQPDDQDLVLEFHQNASGHRKGERWQVVKHDLPQLHTVATKGTTGEAKQIDLQQADRFTVYQQQEVALAEGDMIRITKGGTTHEGTRINNGDRFRVTGFTDDGHIRLHTGKTLDKAYGHLSQGWTTTSHSSQGKTVDQIFIAQSAESFPASSQQQFYVSISRGRERCRVYSDNIRALEQAVKRDGQRMTARELAIEEVEHRDKILAEQARTKKSFSSSKHHHYERGYTP